MGSELDSLFNFNNTWRSIRSIITIEYCLDADESVSDTGPNIIAKGLDDIAANVKEENVTLSICLMEVLKQLMNLIFTFTEEEKQQLNSKATEAKKQTETALISIKETLEEEERNYNATKSIVEKLEEDLLNLNNILEKIKEEIVSAGLDQSTTSKFILIEADFLYK